MTESDAKKLWCPMVRTPSQSGIGNRDNAQDGVLTALDDGSRCIGSACMMFRKEVSFIKTFNGAPLEPHKMYFNGTVDSIPQESVYCGLAGKP